jgi:uncharacterized protein with von Willebrand factor type A (vWA) domain
VSHRNPDIMPPGNLIESLLAFAGRLRDDGFVITPTQLGDCLRAMELVGVTNRPRFRMMMERLFVSNHKDLHRFREHFDKFWVMTPAVAQDDDPPRILREEGPTAARTITEMQVEGEDSLEREPIGAGLEVVKSGMDFSKLRLVDMDRVQDQVLRMARKLGRRLIRRQRSVKRANKLDIRRSVRRSLQHGGELIKPVFRIRRQGRLQIYALVDISGSMAVYGYFFLLFLHSLQKVWPSTYSFVFSTHLTQVSQSLAENEFGRAWNLVLASGVNWSGGTDIGESFMDFYRSHLRPASASRAVVIIVSDGWDRGEPDRLGKAMSLISKHSRKVYWLNPLLSSTSYQPICQGMSQALPHLDYFMPFYNLRTLEDFCHRLEGAEDIARWGGGRIWAEARGAGEAGKEL